LDGLGQVSVVGEGSAGPISEWLIWILTPRSVLSLHERGKYCDNTKGWREVDFIPVGYTACLQVLDKGVNKPFKQFVRDDSIAWLQQAPHWLYYYC